MDFPNLNLNRLSVRMKLALSFAAVGVLNVCLGLYAVFGAGEVKVVAALVCAGCLLSLCAARYISRGIKRSIDELLRVSGLVSDGRLENSARVRILSHDELGSLARQYNFMFDRINALVSALRERSAEAERAVRAKGVFLATMSHEIRTPMNVIIGMSDILASADNLDATQKGYLRDIRRMGKSLLQMINDILDFSKIDMDRIEIVSASYDFRDLFESVCSQSGFLATSKGLKFVHSVDAALPRMLFGDELRVRQVLTNVISNAVKYTRDGLVSVNVGLRGCRGGAGFGVTVSDTGVGIRPSDMPLLFRPFQQFDREMNKGIVGTGLGLAISRRLVDMMGGEILVESEYGVGSVFTIVLPLAEGDAPASVGEVVASADANVLVVDDSAENLTVAQGCLGRHGVTPDTASSGAEAIAMMAAKKYDLVFMDHMMPDMDGIEAARRIRASGDRTPIIALSANAVAGMEDFFLRSGLDGFLAKPIDDVRLNELLAKWLPPAKYTTRRNAPGKGGAVKDDATANLLSSLRGVPGLDVDLGMEYSGGDAAIYVAVLRQMYGKVDADLSKLEKLEQSLADGDIAEYAVKVHAMKGVFANIGAEALASSASKLEAMAKHAAGLLSDTPPFVEAVKNFKTLLSATAIGTVKEQEQEQEQEQNSNTLARVLNALRDACALCKGNEANAWAARLRRQAGGVKDAAVHARLLELAELAEAYEYDAAAEKADGLISDLAM
ncbi:MAG: response regulator [Synergistaceae bacterium]|jgi:signal transduction histidine kinase/ActR/RegA family two-component response regulator/HPt (histidine-containing phosphotransfer) domain-containing protein|nr:response regulator [Synergistaceae bacterium]